MAKKNHNRYYNKNQNSIAEALAPNDVEAAVGETISTNTTDETVVEVIESSNAVVAEKVDQTKYEIVDIVSMDLYYDKKALCDVNVRNTPEKANNIDRILRKGEAITLIAEYDNPIWAKTKDGKYIMKEFLG